MNERTFNMKRILAFVLAFTLIAAFSTVSLYAGINADGYYEPSDGGVGDDIPEGDDIIDLALMGDVNFDGEVNSDDAVAILRHLAGYEIDGDIEMGDYNEDGLVNSDDAVAILRMLAGYID